MASLIRAVLFEKKPASPFTTESERLSPTDKAALRRADLSPGSFTDFVFFNSFSAMDILSNYIIA
jgi:hypothetical protein